jgi:hypothetical protein
MVNLREIVERPESAANGFFRRGQRPFCNNFGKSKFSVT